MGSYDHDIIINPILKLIITLYSLEKKICSKKIIINKIAKQKLLILYILIEKKVTIK